MHDLDRVTAAVNTSSGAAVEALLTSFAASEPRRAQLLPDAFRSRLLEFLADGSEEGGHARVLIASRLHLLFQVDPEWTAEHIVPLFDWSREDEAVGAWQGYLWAPSIDQHLWKLLKPSFLEATKHLEALDRWRESFARLFAAIAVDGAQALRSEETVLCLRRLGDAGRAQVGFWMQKRLEAAQSEAGDLWRERLGPWLRQAWPAAPGLVGPSSAERLIWAITKAGDAIGTAATDVLPLTVPIEHPDLLLHLFLEEDLVPHAPVELLRLVDAMLPGDSGPVFRLNAFVEQVQSMGADLQAPREFRRLQELVLRTGS